MKPRRRRRASPTAPPPPRLLDHLRARLQPQQQAAQATQLQASVQERLDPGLQPLHPGRQAGQRRDHLLEDFAQKVVMQCLQILPAVTEAGVVKPFRKPCLAGDHRRYGLFEPPTLRKTMAGLEQGQPFRAVFTSGRRRRHGCPAQPE
jgi:hypothetical protein